MGANYLNNLRISVDGKRTPDIMGRSSADGMAEIGKNRRGWVQIYEEEVLKGRGIISTRMI